jgi:hypothetical protein
MRQFMVIAPLLALVTCGPSVAELAAADDAKCQSYGARPGSDAYVQCRLTMDTQRATDRSLRRAAVLASP